MGTFSELLEAENVPKEARTPCRIDTHLLQDPKPAPRVRGE